MTSKMRLLVGLGTVATAGALVATMALAKGNTGDNTRPGWGYGDKNHVHTGPPGQSVHPGDNDDHGNNQGNDDNQGQNHDD